MTSQLIISHKDLEAIINNEFERFSVIYNDIPKEGPSSDYIEDDGRQYRYCEFVDNLTNTTYSFSYVWHPDISDAFLSDMFSGCLPESIKIVSHSTLTPPSFSVPTQPPEPTPEEQADKELWQRYEQSQQLPLEQVKDRIPLSVVDDLLDFIKTKKFNILELRAKILPVCIDYGIEQKSFWNYLQKRACR